MAANDTIAAMQKKDKVQAKRVQKLEEESAQPPESTSLARVPQESQLETKRQISTLKVWPDRGTGRWHLATLGHSADHRKWEALSLKERTPPDRRGEVHNPYAGRRPFRRALTTSARPCQGPSGDRSLACNGGARGDEPGRRQARFVGFVEHLRLKCSQEGPEQHPGQSDAGGP